MRFGSLGHIFSINFFLSSPLLKYLGKVEHNNTCEFYKHGKYKMPDRREYVACVLIYTYLYRHLKQAKLIQVLGTVTGRGYW